MEERRSEIKRRVREDVARLARIGVVRLRAGERSSRTDTLQETNATWMCPLREKLPL